jgi:homocitrate synthase NifV
MYDLMIERHKAHKKVGIRDSTLREGEDVAGLSFSLMKKLKIAKSLDQAKIPEIEVVAPGKVFKDSAFVERLKDERLHLRTSGLVYAYSPHFREEIEEVSRYLNRLDLLMPVSPRRKPYDRRSKINQLLKALDFSSHLLADVGVGFPHSTQIEIDFLLKISLESVERGAKRLTIYDTNGSSDPFSIYNLISQLKRGTSVPLFFHGHNDLGMATANSLAAVYAGADGLDVTINGLGDRAGNASLEQVVLNLYLRGFETGIPLQSLRPLSKEVERESGIEVSKLAPIVGEYIFHHQSIAHLECPELFEAFDPNLIDSSRILSKTEK